MVVMVVVIVLVVLVLFMIIVHNCSCGRGRHIRYTGGYSNCGRSGHELVAMVLIL